MTNVFTTLRLERGILACSNLNECRFIVSFIKISLLVYLIISLILYLLVNKCNYLPNNLYLQTYKEYGIYAIILSFLVGIEYVLYHINLREDKYKNISKSKIINSISQSFGQFILGIISFKNGLILATICSTLLRIFVLKNKLNYKYSLRKIKRVHLLLVMKRNCTIIKYLVPGSFVTSIISSILIIYCSIIIDEATIGLIYLSQKILAIPLGLIIKSASDVNFKELSTKNNDEILKIYKTRIRKIFCYSIIPFLIIFITCPYAFSFLFGELWLLSGYYSQILLPGLFIQLLYSPFGNIFWIKKANRLFLILSLFRLLFLIVGMMIGYHYYDTIGIIYGYTISLIIGYILQDTFIKKILIKHK